MFYFLTSTYLSLQNRNKRLEAVINSFLYTTLLYNKIRVVYKKSWWFMRITMLKKKIHCADKAQLHAESAEKSPTSFFDFVMPHETSINAALYLAHGKWWLYLNGIIHWGPSINDVTSIIQNFFRPFSSG